MRLKPQKTMTSTASKTQKRITTASNSHKDHGIIRKRSRSKLSSGAVGNAALNTGQTGQEMKDVYRQDGRKSHSGAAGLRLNMVDLRILSRLV
jgi:hypothetical protein